MAKSKSKKSEDDPIVADFEKALQLLHQQKWQAARDLLAPLAEGDGDSVALEQVRRFLRICDDRLRKEVDSGDSYLNAVIAKNLGSLEEVAELCSRGGLKGKDERFAYLAAAVAALQDDEDEASRMLEKAIEMNPTNKVRAFFDPDFRHLRDRPEFRTLLSAD